MKKQHKTTQNDEILPMLTAASRRPIVRTSISGSLKRNVPPYRRVVRSPAAKDSFIRSTAGSAHQTQRQMHPAVVFPQQSCTSRIRMSLFAISYASSGAAHFLHSTPTQRNSTPIGCRIVLRTKKGGTTPVHASLAANAANKARSRPPTSLKPPPGISSPRH